MMMGELRQLLSVKMKDKYLFKEQLIVGIRIKEREYVILLHITY